MNETAGTYGSVETDIAEAWGKRRYEEHFASELTDADAERLATPNSAYCLLLTILPPTAY
jgi:hypothetical protein